MKTAVVILAGGTGTRLWPLSTNKVPKQFTSILDDKTLIRNTYERLTPQYDNNDIFLSVNIASEERIREQLPEIPQSNYIIEPKKMDRTAAFGLITFIVNSKGYDTVILIPCDDYIGNVEEFLRVLKTTEEVNEKYPQNLLLVGMNPYFPSTGYGYIEMGNPTARFNKDIVFAVQSFKEKPDKKTAEQFISDWRYLWNSGWFIYNTEYLLGKYKDLVPDTYLHLQNCYKLDPKSAEFLEEFSKCEAITFDIAITEKLQDVLVLPASVDWSDIGSWKLVKDIKSNNDKENVFIGNTDSIDTENTLVYATNKKKHIALLGVKDLVIVDTDDVLMITTLDKCQDVKKLVERAPDELK
jgi:mannose-1-phosphate guanylyltransferase